MNESDNTPTPDRQHLAWHVVIEGLIALLLAVIQLVLLRGLNPAVLVLFGFPPLMAFAAVRHSPHKATRAIGASFLALIALGAVIAHIPAVLPKMGGFDRRLPANVDRLLTWYSCVYLLFLTAVVPTHLFIGSLLQRQSDGQLRFAKFTCVLGLLTVGAVWLVMPVVLGAMLGLWPWPK